MKYKGIIFDLDGVICNTDHYHYRAWKQLADSLGIYFDEEINHRLRGVSRMESLAIILEKYDGTFTQEEKVSFSETKNKIYVEMLQKMSEYDLTDGVIHTLEELKKRGHLLAIGSSSKNAKFILKKLGCIHYFDVISDGTNIEKSKPDPEVFLMAADKLGLSPKDCLVVEDAKAGIDAAIKGMFHSAGVGEAFFYEKTNYPLCKLEDLIEIV